MRLDENILPTRFRFATVSPGELQRLRRVRNIVRRGRVAALDQASITFHSGERMDLPGDLVHLDTYSATLAHKVQAQLERQTIHRF